jgi:glucokinase-like ROK family protein
MESQLRGAQASEMAALLSVLRWDGSVSRQEMIRQTGLSRAVVAQRVSQLMSKGLLDDGEAGRSTGGRPPRHIRFRASAGYLLVADIGATSIDVAVTDLASNLLAHHAEAADIALGPELILGRLEKLFEMVCGEAGHIPGRLWGIGIGVPGPVEFATGRPVSPPIMPGWDGYPIRQRFSDHYRVPVWVDNDANLMALGEGRFGVARGHDNVVFIKIGTGIGAGLISDGLPHRGSHGSAGDVGHIQVAEDRNVVCRCGNVGCLEALAGGAALAREAERRARNGSSQWLAEVLERTGTLTAEDVAEAARRGDTTSVELLQMSGRLIGRMLATLVNFFNPSLIVVGGGVAGAGDVLLAAIREVVYGRSLPLATRDLLIKRSSLSSVAGVTGASAMVLDELFSAQRLEAWIDVGHPAELSGAGFRAEARES